MRNGTLIIPINARIDYHRSLRQTHARSIFVWRDLRHWDYVPNPIEGSSSNRCFIGVVWAIDRWVAVINTGETVWSLTGEGGWTAGPELGISANAIAIGATNGQMRTSTADELDLSQFSVRRGEPAGEQPDARRTAVARDNAYPRATALTVSSAS